MTNPATPIFLTTRSGSRPEGPRLNQSWSSRKTEPSRSNRTCAFARSGSSASPGQIGTPCVPVESQASSLLVILHYLLKNNTTFMTGDGAGPNTSRRESEACGSVPLAPLHPREVGG